MVWLRRIPRFFYFFSAVAGFSLVFPIWIFEQWGFVDGAAYFGEILDPVRQRNGFPEHAAGDLLPAIWPKALLYELMPPLQANWVSRILVTTLILFLVYELGTRLMSRAFGLIAVILTLTNSYFWLIMGSDYPEGMVILYLTLALFFAEKAAREQSRRALMILGFALGCTISTAFLSVGYVVGLAAFYILLKKHHRNTCLTVYDLWVAAGFLATLLFFCMGH